MALIASRKEELLFQMLDNLARLSGSDFAALAKPVAVYGNLKWDMLIGSRSGRSGQMKLKPGIGLGGMALRHGIAYQANRTENPSMLACCPVMLAEKLASGVAFPITVSAADNVCGIMLLGRREELPYASHEIMAIESFIPHFVEIMSADAL